VSGWARVQWLRGFELLQPCLDPVPNCRYPLSPPPSNPQRCGTPPPTVPSPTIHPFPSILSLLLGIMQAERCVACHLLLATCAGPEGSNMRARHQSAQQRQHARHGVGGRGARGPEPQALHLHRHDCAAGQCPIHVCVVSLGSRGPHGACSVKRASSTGSCPVHQVWDGPCRKQQALVLNTEGSALRGERLGAHARACTTALA